MADAREANLQIEEELSQTPRIPGHGVERAATSSLRVQPLRIDNPEKNWKLSIADIEERKLWLNYMKAYGACLSATSTTKAPWHVVPADDKKNARLIMAEILLDVFKGLKMAYPKPGAKRRRELQLIRQTLVK